MSTFFSLTMSVIVSTLLVFEPFSAPDGPLPERWQGWRTTGAWSVDAEQAAPPTDPGIWQAVTRVGPSDGLTVAADVTLSPTFQRANVGLAFMLRGPWNHLFCKIEVTAGRPGGLLSIGQRLHGQITSLLSFAAGIGLENGQTYHLSVSRIGDEVACSVDGATLPAPVTVATTLDADQLAMLGATEYGGMRAKVLWDEDDGGSRVDDFSATRDEEVYA